MMKKLFTLFLVVAVALPSFGQKPELKFGKNKKFKIVQFTDTHIIAGDTSSQWSIKAINAVLDAEKPDLVVFTGDVVIESDLEKGWAMVTKPVIDRKLPFAVVIGNHDDESYLSRQQIAAIVEPMPYSLLVKNTAGITGVSNYVVPVKSVSGQKTSAVLYFLDSNAYVDNDSKKGYNWIQPDQIAWYQKESDKYKSANNGKPLPALAFFHIPLPEFNEAYRNEAHPPVGLRLEKECPPAKNSGLFGAMEKCGDVMGVFTGHDHDNDYIAYLRGIALAYGRFTGSATTYGSLKNGGRIIELTEGLRSFKTWIRTRDNEVVCTVKVPEDFVGAKK
ncbi:MAG TPA: metallophosphoesterase family protein [Bacteroidales bacterium]|nr:metallophosphoesterase family protein [Bacteroidales bacterium]